MGYQDSVNGTALTEAYLDEEAKQSVLNYATAAARNADAALSAACREGIVSYQVDENTLKVQRDATLANVSTLGPVHGALLTWTPAVVQSGSVTITSTATYTRTGRWIQGYFELSVTGSGSATNVVTVSLPVTAARATANTFLGPGKIFDVSAGTETGGSWVLNSSTTMKLYDVTNNGVVGARYGGAAGGFSAALASGDSICGQFSFEAAADA